MQHNKNHATFELRNNNSFEMKIKLLITVKSALKI